MQQRRDRSRTELRRGGVIKKKKKPLPENNGKPWTEELDQELCRLFDEGMKKKDLCAHFGRTPGAIESRLQRLGKM